jgi:dipeptidyl aminopeptidase/acylaminoacyl peptidase
MKAVVLALALAAAGPSLWAKSPADIPVEDFWKQSEFVNIQISPDGKYFGAIVPDQETRALVIFTREERKITGVARFTDKRQVAGFAWISPTRVAFTISDRLGRLVAPIQRGELLFMDVNGKERVGYGGGRRNAVLTNTLRDEEDYVIVTDYLPSQRGEGGDQVLYRVNAKTGKALRKAFSPVPASFFLTTREGEARVAAGSRGFQQAEVWYRGKADKEWRKIHSEKDSGQTMTPLFMDVDGEHFYATMTEKTGPDGLYRVDPMGNTTLVARDELVNPTGYVRALEDGRLLGVSYNVTQPKRVYLDPEHPDAKILRSLEPSFPGQNVNLVNATDDGKLIVFFVSSDRNPGEFYLFDRASAKATYLASVQQWIDPELMSEMKAVQYTARDGTVIHGWLTLPRDSNGKNLPLIVNPHGGPFGPYDTWGYNPEVQLFASRGYAVLQPNFRGSGGFGESFIRLGWRQWGGTMQDDLTDATKWAIEQGIADPKRICIAGASYGAYAALMGVVKEPDLYQCAVGYVGVYDLTLMDRRGDISESESGLDFLKTVLGTDDSALALVSPNKQASRIKAGVFLAAGKEDRRAPPVHTERMAEAIRAAGGQLDASIIQEGEAHGFYKTENNVALYSKMLAFFDRYIGSGARKGETVAGND